MKDEIVRPLPIPNGAASGGVIRYINGGCGYVIKVDDSNIAKLVSLDEQDFESKHKGIAIDNPDRITENEMVLLLHWFAFGELEVWDYSVSIDSKQHYCLGWLWTDDNTVM